MAFAMELPQPSTDGLGVKRYRVGHVAGGSQTVDLFERPRAALPSDRCPRWMMRIVTRAGQHVETRYYKTRGGVRTKLGNLFRVCAVIFPE